MWLTNRTRIDPGENTHYEVSVFNELFDITHTGEVGGELGMRGGQG